MDKNMHDLNAVNPNGLPVAKFGGTYKTLINPEVLADRRIDDRGFPEATGRVWVNKDDAMPNWLDNVYQCHTWGEMKLGVIWVNGRMSPVVAAPSGEGDLVYREKRDQ